MDHPTMTEARYQEIRAAAERMKAKQRKPETEKAVVESDQPGAGERA